MEIKISHEVPLCLLDHSRTFNSYDYLLPHLMDQYEEYKNFFIKSKSQGRHIMMDNSVHELGKPYHEKRLHYRLEQFQPQEFFVPDYLEDKTQSIVSAKKWIQHQSKYVDTTFIAVVQALSFGEALECYQIYRDLGYKKIAFSYGASYYNEIIPHPNKNLGKALGRLTVISKLYDIGVINKSDSIHLLGTACPFEFSLYKDMPFIKSIDTSNPIMLTLDGIKYNSSCTNNKPKSNMNDCFEIPIEKIDINLLKYNINKFKEILEV